MTWSTDLAEFSRRLDEWTVAEGPMHRLRIRCSKLHEEAGEVEEAMIAYEESNPRKPAQLAIAARRADLTNELLDVATAALGAVEHMTGNQGTSAGLLTQHCDHLIKRLRAAETAYQTNTDARAGDS